VVRAAAVFGGIKDRRIEQHYGGIGGVVCLTLWDTGSSHNLVTPEFAEELVRGGALLRKCAPLTLQHGAGDDEEDAARVVLSAAPATAYVIADVLLCHKGRTYRHHGARFYVYGGTLPDAVVV
jgi:hypothetical protein